MTFFAALAPTMFLAFMVIGGTILGTLDGDRGKVKLTLGWVLFLSPFMALATLTALWGV